MLKYIILLFLLYLISEIDVYEDPICYHTCIHPIKAKAVAAAYARFGKFTLFDMKYSPVIKPSVEMPKIR